MRKPKTTLLIISLALMLLGNNFALAQLSPGGKDDSPKEEENPWFDQIDTNHDMKISRKELIEHRKKRAEEQFKTSDTDNDGFVSLDEWKTYIKDKKGALDTDPIGG